MCETVRIAKEGNGEGGMVPQRLDPVVPLMRGIHRFVKVSRFDRAELFLCRASAGDRDERRSLLVGLCGRRGLRRRPITLILQ